MLGAPAEATEPGIAFGVQFSFPLDLANLDAPLSGWSLTFTELAATLRWDGELLVAMTEDAGGGYVETGQPYGVDLHRQHHAHRRLGDQLRRLRVDRPATGPDRAHRDHRARRRRDPALLDGGAPAAARRARLRRHLPRDLDAPARRRLLPPSWSGAAARKYTVPPPPLETLTDSDRPEPPGRRWRHDPGPPGRAGLRRLRITFANCAIGTGGFSGNVAFDVDATGDLGDEPIPNLIPAVEEDDLLTDAEAGVRGLSAELFGFGLALQRFEVGIRRNAVVSTARSTAP